MSSPRVEELIGRLEKGGRKSYEIFGRLTPERWQRIIYSEPTAWSARDLLAHFVSAEERLLELAQNVAAGGEGAPEGFDFDALNAEEQTRLRERSPQELLTALSAARQATLDWVRTLDDEDLDRVGRHPVLGYVSLEVMLTAIYAHQLMHMREVQPKLV